MLAGGVIERRRAADLSVAPGQRKLVGYAAVFGQETRISDFTEVTARSSRFFPSHRSPDRATVKPKLIPPRSPRSARARRSRPSVVSGTSSSKRSPLESSSSRNVPDFVRASSRAGSWSTSARISRPFKLAAKAPGRITLHEISVVHAWPAYQGTSVEPRARRPHLEAALLYLETI